MKTDDALKKSESLYNRTRVIDRYIQQVKATAAKPSFYCIYPLTSPRKLISDAQHALRSADLPVTSASATDDAHPLNAAFVSCLKLSDTGMSLGCLTAFLFITLLFLAARN